MAMDLTIIIVSYNAQADLRQCLASLQANPPLVSYTIIVVDNASTDGSAAMVREAWPAVRLIESPENLGFARANNAGIRQSEGDLILLLNGDTIVPAGAVDRLVAALRDDPSAAAAGPRLVDAEGRAELSFGRMIGPLNELRQKLLGRLHARRVPVVAARVDQQLATRRYVDWVSGACLLVWRRDAEAVGLLDERFFMYTEDVDFCAALRARGRRVLFTPDAEIVHLRGRSRQSAPSATNHGYRRSQLAFYAKHHPRWEPWLRRYLAIRGKLPR
jgi:GT2 family glycosyltransferase